jgi:hypothetical protein
MAISGFSAYCHRVNFLNTPITKIGSLKQLLWAFLIILGWVFLFSPVWAQETSASAPATIETRWDSIWGMKYFQNDIELSNPQLKNLLQSADDPQIKTLLDQSESDSTLGTVGLGTSVAASLVCLLLPATNISLGTLKITVPYLPVQIPALAIGVVAAFFKNAAGAAQFAAVQRYNDKTLKPDPLTWNITPESKGLILNLNYAL